VLGTLAGAFAQSRLTSALLFLHRFRIVTDWAQPRSAAFTHRARAVAIGRRRDKSHCSSTLLSHRGLTSDQSRYELRCSSWSDFRSKLFVAAICNGHLSPFCRSIRGKNARRLRPQSLRTGLKIVLFLTIPSALGSSTSPGCERCRRFRKSGTIRPAEAECIDPRPDGYCEGTKRSLIRSQCCGASPGGSCSRIDPAKRGKMTVAIAVRTLAAEIRPA